MYGVPSYMTTFKILTQTHTHFFSIVFINHSWDRTPCFLLTVASQKKKPMCEILDIHYNWMQAGNDGIETNTVAERFLSYVLHDWDPITPVFESGRKLIRSQLTGNGPQLFNGRATVALALWPLRGKKLAPLWFVTLKLPLVFNTHISGSCWRLCL